MLTRRFEGADGHTWEVWSVIPGRGGRQEHRKGYDRRSPDPVATYDGPERRRADRRTPSHAVAPELQTGWLAFESSTERRRLAPIPPHWEEMSDATLDKLCRQASPVDHTLAPVLRHHLTAATPDPSA